MVSSFILILRLGVLFEGVFIVRQLRKMRTRRRSCKRKSKKAGKNEDDEVREEMRVKTHFKPFACPLLVIIVPRFSKVRPYINNNKNILLFRITTI